MKCNERIRGIREDHDITQREIAHILNISQRTYSDYESGRIRIPVEALIQLAEYYNLNMDYISGISNIKKPFPKK
jgi:transcriptional regulator with XRE-family HTH domain